MKPIPFPLRVAAGLAVTTAERVRELPKQITGFPVTVASQVLQASMRVQQQVTELAIKGDDVLAMLRPTEDAPSWATFDEDLPDQSKDTSAATPAPPASPPPSSPPEPAPPAATPPEPAPPATTPEEPAPATHEATAAPVAKPAPGPVLDPPADVNGHHPDALPGNSGSSAGSPEGTGPANAPAGVTGYDQLSLAQVRARLRRFSIDELEELLAHERAHADRPSFTGMLARRIGNLRKAGEDGPASQNADETGR